MVMEKIASKLNLSDMKQSGAETQSKNMTLGSLRNPNPGRLYFCAVLGVNKTGNNTQFVICFQEFLLSEQDIFNRFGNLK